ncbi:hypothetical protein CC79DRAFT_1334047 [Sarocladium strictum]
MQFSLANVILGFAALAAAAPSSPNGFTIVARQNGNRPVPQAVCCVANINLRQDKCRTTNGQAGRCVQWTFLGGNALSCVAEVNLTCDANRRERGETLCRARASGGKLFDGNRLINTLSQAQVE